MIDTGASGIGYISKSYAQRYGLRLTPLDRHIELFGFNGKKVVSGLITHIARLELRYLDHCEDISLYVTTLGKHPIILGQPWMKLHKVVPDWDNEILKFTAQNCLTSCFRQTSTKTEPELSETRKPEHEPEARISDLESESAPGSLETEKLDICMIGAAPFARLARNPKHEVFAISMADIEKALAPKTYTDPAAKVPEEYHPYLEVFSRKEADKLPEHRPYDHKIELEPGKQPGFSPLYGMTQDELKVLRNYLDENLTKGFIRASKSPVASPVLFVRKPNGGLRLCVDYRKLNEITIKNRYPIPLIQETLSRLSKAHIFTKLDIIAAFNRLRIAKGDEWLTAFRTRYGLFEYKVMPFGLANAPSTFQHYVNDTLRPYLDVFCTAYMDDILIYSQNISEHREHVELVLKALRDAGLQLDVDKCEFHTTEVLYLGLIISPNGIRMDPKKVEAITAWEAPENVKDVRAFLGFANFYTLRI